ncbi:unnamed protein product [Heterobilharzia americana]|nr:unnamed protein product [Heterobilharzia americana]
MTQRSHEYVPPEIISNTRDCYLLLQSGELLLVRYMNGLQLLGFCFVFFGLASAFLGLLDVVLIPSLSPTDNKKYPVEFNLANAYGIPIYSGVLMFLTGAMALRTVVSERFTSLRKFYVSLWMSLLLTIIYWCCLIAAISWGYFSTGTSYKISNSHLVTRVFTAVNSGLSLIPCSTGLVMYSRPVLGRYPNIWCCNSLLQRLTHYSPYRQLSADRTQTSSTGSVNV